VVQLVEQVMKKQKNQQLVVQHVEQAMKKLKKKLHQLVVQHVEQENNLFSLKEK
jgi:hypothetical protein